MDQKIEALESITFEGAKIEDLMLNFTFPGHDDIELIDDGADMPVTLSNLE